MAKKTRLQKRRNYKQKSRTRVKKTRMKRAGKKRGSRKLYGGSNKSKNVNVSHTKTVTQFETKFPTLYKQLNMFKIRLTADQETSKPEPIIILIYTYFYYKFRMKDQNNYWPEIYRSTWPYSYYNFNEDIDGKTHYFDTDNEVLPPIDEFTNNYYILELIGKLLLKKHFEKGLSLDDVYGYIVRVYNNREPESSRDYNIKTFSPKLKLLEAEKVAYELDDDKKKTIKSFKESKFYRTNASSSNNNTNNLTIFTIGGANRQDNSLFDGQDIFMYHLQKRIEFYEYLQEKAEEKAEEEYKEILNYNEEWLKKNPGGKISEPPKKPKKDYYKYKELIPEIISILSDLKQKDTYKSMSLLEIYISFIDKYCENIKTKKGLIEKNHGLLTVFHHDYILLFLVSYYTSTNNEQGLTNIINIYRDNYVEKPTYPLRSKDDKVCSEQFFKFIWQFKLPQDTENLFKDKIKEAQEAIKEENRRKLIEKQANKNAAKLLGKLGEGFRNERNRELAALHQTEDPEGEVLGL